MDYLKILPAVCCCLTAITAKPNDHTGSDFIVAFFRDLNLRKLDAYLIIATVNDVNVTLNMTYRDQKTSHLSALQLTPGIVEHINLKEQYGNIYMPFPVIRIEASHPVSITAFVDGSKSAASYLVFPLDVAGLEYRMMPFCNKLENGVCVCAIVTLEKNTMIVLENENHGNISVYTAEHAVGEDTIDYLSLPHSKIRFIPKLMYSHISLESHGDFSGLLLRANSSVVVFCGGIKQDATMSMEQIPATPYYGRGFYTFPIAYHAMSPSKLRFISHYNCTTVETLQGKFRLDAGEIQEISTNKVVASQIFSNKPIAIMQIFSGTTPKARVPNYQEGMLLLPAIDQYISTVIIPRRKKQESSTRMAMFVGLISDVCYSFASFSGNKRVSRKTLSNGIIREIDDDGMSIKLTRDCDCQKCGDEHTFGGYTFRTNTLGTEASFSVVGYKFISRENETQRYMSEPCGNRKDAPYSTTKSTAHTPPSPVKTEPTTKTPPLSVKPDPTTQAPPSSVKPVTDTKDKNITLVTGNTTKSNTTETFESTTVKEKEQSTISTAATISHCSKCSCQTESTGHYKTEKELLQKIEEIKRELTIKKINLSSYRRRKTSAGDQRISAKGIGLLGATILCSVASFVVIMDFPTLAHQVAVLWKNALGRGVRAVRGCVGGQP